MATRKEVSEMEYPKIEVVDYRPPKAEEMAIHSNGRIYNHCGDETESEFILQVTIPPASRLEVIRLHVDALAPKDAKA